LSRAVRDGFRSAVSRNPAQGRTPGLIAAPLRLSVRLRWWLRPAPVGPDRPGRRCQFQASPVSPRV